MWEKKVKKVYSGVTKEQVWKTWIDLDRWSMWNEDVEYCKLKDSFEAGGTFEMKPKGAPVVNLTIEEVIENTSWTDCLHLPGSKMLGKHEVKELENGNVELITTISITGMSSSLWVKMLGEKVAEKMPHQMDSLILLVKNN